MSLPFYKMYPRDFFEGTQRISLEAKGAYIMVLNLMYTRDGPVADEDGYIARYVGCSIRKWQKLRLELIGQGKLIVEDGMIRNSRADEELLKRASYQDQKRENRTGSKEIKAVQKRPSASARKPEPEPEPEIAKDADASLGRVRAKRDAQGGRLPDDWSLTDDLLVQARTAQSRNDAPLTDEEIRDEAAKFRDYWRAQPGQRGRKTDWPATWRNWIRRAAPDIVRRRRGKPSRPEDRTFGSGAHDSVFAAFAVAGLEASGRRPHAARNDHGDGAGEGGGPAGAEVLDLEDPRGADARRPADGERAPGRTVHPLSRAAGG